MKTLFENKFVCVVFDSSQSLIEGTWFPSTIYASDEDFKTWSIEVVRYTQEYQAQRMLANTKDYKFTITPDLQEWSVSHIFEPMAAAGIRKLAMIVSSDLFPQVSLEQFVDEYGEKQITTRYFEDVEEARQWLIAE